MAANKSTTKTKKGASKAGNTKDGFQREIVLLLILALSIILFISNCGFGGTVGKVIRSVGFGLFGLMVYVFPVLLFLGAAFFISNRRNSLIVKKMTAGILGFLLWCGLIQLLTEGYLKSTTLLDYYRHASENGTGGGIVGGAVCMMFCSAFGVVGAYVLLVIFLIIATILMTQRSFFGFVGKLFGGIRSGVRRSLERKKENRPPGEEQTKAREAERKFRLEAKASQRKKIRERESADGAEAEEALPRRKRSGKKSAAFMDGTQLVPEGMNQWEKEKKDPEFDPFPKEESQKEESQAPLQQEDFSFSIHRSEPAAPEEFLKEAEEEALIPQKTCGSAKAAGGGPSRSSREEIQDGIRNIRAEIQGKPEEKREYLFPPLSLLKKPGKKSGGDSDAHLRETAKKLTETFKSFGVNVTITNVSCGPSVTRYELQPEQGVKVSRIVSLSDDIKLNLAAADIRIEAPIPGKAAVGIEVPNKENSAVMLRELLQSEAFQKAPSKLAFAAGKDIAGQPVVADIAKMPHLLIAGATGSGKSVCINTLIMSILYKASPEEVKLIMIDPKVVELSVYNGIPHLYIPVVTDPKKAAGALNWAVSEMTDRYNLFAEYNVRNLSDYNAKLAELPAKEGEEPGKKLPQIVIIVDELADLMMVAPGEVEDAICRLAQLARAAGIHLIIATQRPSVNVITGLIKANMPSRIAFAVSSGVDSRTILDMNGAEKLLGKGDMLFYPQGYPKPARLQGAFVSDEEVSRVVEFLADKNPFVEYSSEIEEKIKSTGSDVSGGGEERDVHFAEAGRFIIEKDKASIGMLQRMFKIGFNRAARIMDQLSEAGVVGPEEGTKPRKILMSMEEFENYIEESL